MVFHDIVLIVFVLYVDCQQQMPYWAGQFYDSGYPHDGRADNTAYRHDRRADKRRYPHDREIDIQMLKMSRNGYIIS